MTDPAAAPGTLAQQAYGALKSRILEGGFAPEDMLTERGLAAASGVSRTPLRAAISRLEAEGVIARLPGGALMIRPVTAETLLEIVQTRRLLEAAAAARAAERIAAGAPLPATLEASRDTMRAYAEGRDTAFDTFWADDDAFHAAVAETAGLQLLPELLAQMRAEARRCTITRAHDRFAEQAAEHLAVIEAIAAGRPDAARAAMEAHLESVRARFLGWLGRP
ncbi:GntR family transcriptional regulator [Paroceanicella profunda]|uniref:GntR family transcriptional regulator n=1 Tax=Paroceanicella profunda TaxID=2579971 RepID=A0A5B8FXC6_9RHOB|nr:GntR family transcriptional regulator [Paroceanicella profunda]QDL91169.1 GntR family transcriptional regulator [Paroceanicella profunda]